MGMGRRGNAKSNSDPLSPRGRGEYLKGTQSWKEKNGNGEGSDPKKSVLQKRSASSRSSG